MQKFNYYFRMVLIGIWAFIVSVLVFFVSLVTWGSTFSARMYARMLGVVGMWLLGIKIKLTGEENFPEEPCVFLGNHQSNLDAYFLGHIFPPRTVVIAKREMLKVPLFGIILMASQNILVDRDDSASAKKTIKDSVEAIQKRKHNILIFPEGTRSLGKGLGEFKKGAFVMAIAAQAPIVPIVNQPLEHVVDTQKKILKSGTHQIKVLPAIPTAGMKFRDADRLIKQLEDLFREELAKFPAV